MDLKHKIIYSLETKGLRYDFGDDSEWIINETEKSRKFICIKKGEYGDDDIPMEIITRKDNKHKNCCKSHGDKTYTIYLNRDGQPIYFYPKWIKGRE